LVIVFTLNWDFPDLQKVLEREFPLMVHMCELPGSNSLSWVMWDYSTAVVKVLDIRYPTPLDPPLHVVKEVQNRIAGINWVLYDSVGSALA
jgi:hypothetical protein